MELRMSFNTAHGHGSVLNCMDLTKKISRLRGYLAPKTMHYRTVKVNIPSRDEWTSISLMEADDIKIFTDVSKMVTGA